MRNTLLEEKEGSGGLSKGGVLEDEGGAEGDTAGEEAMDDGIGMDLLGLGEGVGKDAELDRVCVGVSVSVSVGRGRRERRKVGLLG